MPRTGDTSEASVDWYGAKELNMYFVYVLRSDFDNKFYIGFTDNVKRRLSDHNSGKVLSISLKNLLNYFITRRICPKLMLFAANSILKHQKVK